MKIKRLSKIFSIAFVMMLLISANIYAASITGNSDLKVGETVTLTFDFGYNIGGYNSINVVYDSSVLQYVSGDALNETSWYDNTYESNGIRTKSYTFKAIGEGTTKVTVKAAYVVNSNTLEEAPSLVAEKLINVSKQEEQQQPPESNYVPEQNNGNVTQTPTDSGNNYLRYLQLSEEGMTPYFSRNVTNYSLAVGENVNSIQVLARAEDANARVEISGHESIVDGDNVIQIKVTAPNGNYRIYKITVTKGKDKTKTNAYLEQLIVENYELDKEFQSEELEYNLGEILSTVKKLNVIATAKDPNAKIEIIGADKLVEEGEGKITVKVTAPDGTTVREYTIKYTVKKATAQEEAESQMQQALKEVNEASTPKQKIVAYAKYIWQAIKKNYLLVLMYLLIIIEFIQIIVLRRKYKKAIDNDNGPDDPNDDNNKKEILKIEKEDKEEPKLDVPEQEPQKIETPNVGLLDEVILKDVEEYKTSRKGSLEHHASELDGIKLVDLDKNEGPQDELTFNIFDNLNEDDIKKMLEDQINGEE